MRVGLVVCLPPIDAVDAEDLQAAVWGSILPFSDQNDPGGHGKFDYWTFDWSDLCLWCKPEAVGDPRLFVDDEPEPGVSPRNCIGGPCALIDFEATRQAWRDRIRQTSSPEAAGCDDFLAHFAIASGELLTVDGQWFSQWGPGPLAQPDTGPIGISDFLRRTEAYLAALPGDTVIVRLRLHR